jgi:signal transduction histidine kinase
LMESDLDRPAEIRRNLATISASLARESRLVDDLLDAGQALTGRLRVNLGIVSLTELAMEVVEALTPLALAKQQRLLVADHSPQDRRFVLGDSLRLHQLLTNLLENAAKFTPRGGELTLRLGGDALVTVDVEDTGPGFPRELGANIFEPFVRTDRDNESGLGLGLAIARQIAQLHQGTLSAAQRTPSGGATLSLRLPRAPALEAAVAAGAAEA